MPTTSQGEGRGAYVRSFNRFEFKYVVPRSAAHALRDDLQGYAHPDPHSGTRGYPIQSVYWDSPALTFFWEKIDGEKYRRKLRFRQLPGTPTTSLWRSSSASIVRSKSGECAGPSNARVAPCSTYGARSTRCSRAEVDDPHRHGGALPVPLRTACEPKMKPSAYHRKAFFGTQRA